MRLPFSLLTNGGGDTEQDRANLVNRKMFGCEEKLHLSVDQMICCHTPLKRMVPEFGDKFVLVSGNGDVVKICK